MSRLGFIQNEIKSKVIKMNHVINDKSNALVGSIWGINIIESNLLPPNSCFLLNNNYYTSSDVLVKIRATGNYSIFNMGGKNE